MMKALIPALALLILNLTDGAAPTKEKYVYSGETAWASVNWQECDENGWWSSMWFDGYEGMSKVLENGKPETNKYAYVEGWYERWYECTPDSMTRTYLSFSEPVPGTGVDIKTNLKSGAVSATFKASVLTEVCAHVCYEVDCGEDTPCPPECRAECPSYGTDPEYEWAPVTLKATFVGTGTPYASSSRGSSRSPGSSYHYKYTGTSSDATVSAMSITVDGGTMPMPTNAEYGGMYTTKYGTISKYVNGI